MIVLDASVVVALILRTAEAAAIDRRIAEGDVSLHAPHLVDVEAAHAIRRQLLTRQLDTERASDALSDLGSLSVVRHAHHELIPRAWELRENLTMYDAVYVALAETLGAPLLTLDARIAAAPHRARVDVIRA